MKRNIKTICLLSLIGVMGLASCSTPSQYSSLAKIEITTNATTQNKIYSPEEVTISETFHTIENKRQYNTRVLPSIGDINLLVIPILVPGYTTIDLDDNGTDDKELVREDIQKVFFGEKEDEKIGYESVASFYKESSYNKLNLQGEVTPWFDLAASTDAYSAATDIDVEQTYDVVRKAVNWAKDILNVDMTKYDNDKDGYIDGVWCVYSCPDYTKNGPRTDYNNYWAYTTWGNQVATEDDENEYPDVDDPVYNVFCWGSYDFMYSAYGQDKIDAHTYIHETGHMLGLSDYYSDSGSYNPIGKIDMMDSNVIDHNSYSKMLLGWTKPYVVSGNGKIDLKSMQNENSFIVIPSESTTVSNEFDPFGEYMLIELYTNEGLNTRDSKTALEDRPLAMNSKGVRIYHVDNRKFIVNTTDKYAITCNSYQGETIDSNHRLVLPITNSRGNDTYNKNFNLPISNNLYDEIRMIEANNVSTFSNGGYQKDKSLFKQGDSFTLEEYKKFFINDGKFDSGDSFSYQISIGEIN